MRSIMHQLVQIWYYWLGKSRIDLTSASLFHRHSQQISIKRTNSKSRVTLFASPQTISQLSKHFLYILSNQLVIAFIWETNTWIMSTQYTWVHDWQSSYRDAIEMWAGNWVYIKWVGGANFIFYTLHATMSFNSRNGFLMFWSVIWMHINWVY